MAGWLSAAMAAPGVAATEPLSPQQQQAKFHLPPGFEIQLVVADPDIGQPMNLNFDARGRLWITHSVEYPYPVKGASGDVQLPRRFPGVGNHAPRDRITVVSDIGASGKPGSIVHFGDGLNIPIGHTPLNDGSSALVYSIPSIHHLKDTTGDGAADKRTPLYSKFGNIDTHGMISSLTRWIDGWVYGCHGFSNTSEVKDAAGNVVKMNSGNTYRFRSDGSRFEQFTWGQVNPFGMTFDAWGNLYNSDCHSSPVYMLLRGGYYPSFGKPHDGLAFAPTMINHSHGSTGICGPAYYAASHFPPDYRNNLFICNPVNCTVHRDKLKQHGSTFLIDTQPDFITCDDGWFRPVDAITGPDGALYIADFYNCIIGHYEVPLNHPRRDRTHGRVWRVVYTGAKQTAGNSFKPATLKPMPDLTRQTPVQTAAMLGDTNLSVRTLATNWLVDSVEASNAKKQEVIQAVRAAMHRSPESRLHCIWVLERLGAIAAEDVTGLSHDASPLVRTHLIRILAERNTWSEASFKTARDALTDPSPMVRRVAADALGRHAAVENVQPLHRLIQHTPPADTHLLHTARMALRNQLRDASTLTQILQQKPDAKLLARLAELALSVKTPAAARLVLLQLEQKNATPGKDAIAYAVENLDKEGLARLTAVVRARFSGLQQQFNYLQAIGDGLQRRGESSGAIKQWAAALAQKLLDEPAAATAWSQDGSQWVTQQRKSADGSTDTFWSSLPRGEHGRGVLKSGDFTVPETLSFYTAGHNGAPGPEKARNFIRLRESSTGRLLAEAKPPRNDVAQQVTWSLKKHQGSTAYIELVDNFSAPGYAWLAAGRFSVHQLNGDAFQPFSAACALIVRYRLSEFEPRLKTLIASATVAAPLRREAASAIISLHPDARLSTLLSALQSPLPAALKGQILQTLAAPNTPDGNINKLLGDVFSHGSRAAQQQYAATLTTGKTGAIALIDLAEAGKAPPQLLTLATTKTQLLTAAPEEMHRIKKLTAALPARNLELLKLIDARTTAFLNTTSDSTAKQRGAAVFTKNCAVCHQVGGKGEKTGPQLDGVGARGASRLLEDILNPNRNVDPAFRAAIIETTDGQIHTGLVRRQEGATLVFAGSDGKEITLPKASIETQTLTTRSIMPANFSQTIKPKDLYDLLAYLLTLKQQQ